MPLVSRRPHTSRSRLGPYKRHELLTGEIDYPVEGYTGYGDGVGTDLTAFIDDEMRADWLANRDELLEFWRSGQDTVTYFHPDSKTWLFIVGDPGTRPWAALQFDDEGKRLK